MLDPATAFPTLIEHLKQPGLYPHAADQVALLETHISVVLLAGEYAYKLKKPYNLGFLDFTTLEARKYYCEEEQRLNQRLAPDLYLGVVTITGSADTPRWGGAGAPIEYAVKMRRFPQQALLSNVLARNELQAAQLDALACRMAAFHQAVPAAAMPVISARFSPTGFAFQTWVLRIRPGAPPRIATGGGVRRRWGSDRAGPLVRTRS